MKRQTCHGLTVSIRRCSRSGAGSVEKPFFCEIHENQRSLAEGVWVRDGDGELVIPEEDEVMLFDMVVESCKRRRYDKTRREVLEVARALR